MKHIETWRAVPGYEGRYEVSDMGNVRSVDHTGGRRKVPGKRLSPGSAKSGHLTVSLGRHNTKPVHALVLSAFVGPRPDGYDILHLNHTPWDNRLVNLKYGTRSENLKMDYAAGVRRLPVSFGEAHGLSKLDESAVRFIRQSKLKLVELGRMFGVCYQTIAAVRERKTWGHVV